MLHGVIKYILSGIPSVIGGFITLYLIAPTTIKEIILSLITIFIFNYIVITIIEAIYYRLTGK